MSGEEAEKAYTEKLPVIARLPSGKKWFAHPTGVIRRRTDSGLSKFFCEFEDENRHSVMVIEAEKLELAQRV